MVKKFNHLNVPDQWNTYFTRYPQGFTILEALFDWIAQVDNMVDNINEWNEYLEEFVNTFDKKLGEKVREVLQEWFEDGTLAHLVNSVIFKTHVYTYNTVLDMQKDKGLIVGDRVKTMGHHTLSDGGGSYYIIVEDNTIVNLGNPTLDNGLTAKLLTLDGKVKVTQYGARPVDGHDNIDSFTQALEDHNHVIVPVGNFSVSDTIKVDSYQSLVGEVENTREQGDAPLITFIGGLNRNKAVILIGRNPINVEPVNDSSNIVVKNLYIDANNLVGFGVYGTYVTNQSIIDNITVRNSREFNMYFAKSWYARFTNLTSLSCRNNGLAFGMPLEYLDGEQIVWPTTEMNNVKIDQIQSQRAGTYFADEKAAVWAADGIYSRKGYGIGAGIGNGFTMTGFTSERSGGVNLYSYSRSQPAKSVKHGYLERAMEGSGKTGSEITGIILEVDSPTGSPDVYEDIMVNYTNGGGIYVTGNLAPRKIRLKDIHQPRFLRPLNLKDIATTRELYAYALKENVYNACGTYNMDMSEAKVDAVHRINSRYSMNDDGTNFIEFNYLDSSKTLWARNVRQEDGSVLQPHGTINVVNNDGTKLSLNFPPNLTEEWTYMGAALERGIGIEKGGQTGDDSRFYDLKIMSMKPTYY